ncbi:MAG: hypothetical protein ACYTFG_10570 [Planctomycetota bacterium]|jgi:hypothetical protein
MPRSTGIQICGKHLRAVELRGTAKNPQMVRCAEMVLPEEEGGKVDVGAALRGLMDQNRVSRDPAVLTLPALSLKVRTLNVPFTDADQIGKVVRTLMEEHLHGLPIEEALVVHHKVRELDETSSRVMTLATGQDEVASQYNFSRFAGVYPEEGWAVHVDLESERSGVLVVKDRELQSLRAFRLSLDGEGAPESGDSPQEVSEEGGKEASTGPAPKEGVAEKLSREILRTLMAEDLGGEIEAAFVSGPLSQSSELVETLGKKTELPFVPLPLPESLKQVPSWASTPFGAALKFFGHDNLHFDFRQDTLGFKRKFERVHVGLTVLAAMVFLLFSLLGYHFHNLHTTQRKRHTKVANQAVAYFREALRKETLPPKLPLKGATKFVLDGLTKKHGEMTGQGMDKGVPQISSSLEAWKVLSTRIQGVKNQVKYLTLKEIKLSPKEFAIKGEVDSPQSVDVLENIISTDPRFAEVIQGSPSKLTKDGDAYTFDFRGKITSMGGP